MYERIILTVTAATVLALSGCGTAANVVNHDPQIYGGTRTDIALIHRPEADKALDVVPPHPLVTGTVGFMAFLDMPLSLIGDTVTLPYTAVVAYAASTDKPPTPSKQAEQHSDAGSSSQD